MKYLLSLLFIIGNTAYAQNIYQQGSFIPGDIGYNLDRVTSAGMSSGSEDAAMLNAQADFVYKSSLANINNQKAYGLALNNQVMRASVFFEKRQINRYNRALEEIQYKNLVRMKAQGIYSKEMLDSIFDIRYKTGYITP